MHNVSHGKTSSPPRSRAAVVAALTEGNSLRSTCRMTGVARNTVTKLLVDLGTACSAYMDEQLVDLPCKRLQVDEIWSFVYAKAKNVPADKQGVFRGGRRVDVHGSLRRDEAHPGLHGRQP